MKKDSEEIKMILGMIPWRDFLKSNMILPKFADNKLDNLVKTIRSRITDIKSYWEQNSHLRLGQVLIKLNIVEDDPILKTVNETQWMGRMAELELA